MCLHQVPIFVVLTIVSTCERVETINIDVMCLLKVPI